jgi:hypothetical protein
MAIADQTTSQKLEENPLLPVDTQANLVYTLTRIFRAIASIVNPLVAWVANWTRIDVVNGTNFTRLDLNAPAPTGTAELSLNKTGTGTASGIVGRKDGVARWQIHLGGTATESGSNAGSDFAIFRYNDAGALIGTPFHIARATGRVTISDGGLNVTGKTGADSISTTGNIATGALFWSGGAGTSGFVGNVSAASGMGFLFDGGNFNYLCMGAGLGTPWSWQWNRNNGTLAWLNSAGAAIVNISPTGGILANQNFSTTSYVGLGVNGVTSDGSTYTLQSLVMGNPSWASCDFRTRHQHGQWAGWEFIGSNDQIRFTMSSGTGWGEIGARAFTVQSDARSKRNVTPVDALAVLDGIEAHTYEYIPIERAKGDRTPIYGKTRHCGTMAQDWLERLPEAVTDSGDGNLMLDYAAISAVTAQAVSELIARVKVLETRITALEGTP